MSPACIPNDVKDAVLSNPIGYEFMCYGLVISVRPVIVDDLADGADVL